MNKKFHIFLTFLLVSYCTNNTDLTSQAVETYEQPVVKFVCSETINEDYVILDVYLLINSKNSKLYNGSIKGTGVASNFYRNISDIPINNTLEGSYIYEITKNGSYSVIFYIQDLNESFVYDCSGQINLTTTTTTRPTTTTTTIHIVINTSFEQTIKGCSNNKTTSNLLVNNTTSTVDVKFVLEKSTNSNNTFSVVYDGIISKSDQLNFTQELKIQDWVGWRWKIYSGNEWSEYNYSDYFEGCWDVTGIEYDNNLYKKRWFTGINDNPYICEIPGTGTQQGYDWGRCITSEQWREYPNMEKEDGDWVRFCARDGWYEHC